MGISDTFQRKFPPNNDYSDFKKTISTPFIEKLLSGKGAKPQPATIPYLPMPSRSDFLWTEIPSPSNSSRSLAPEKNLYQDRHRDDRFEMESEGALIYAHGRVNDPMAKLQFLRVGWGGVGIDVNVPWTCSHGWCYVAWWGAVGRDWC